MSKTWILLGAVVLVVGSGYALTRTRPIDISHPAATINLYTETPLTSYAKPLQDYLDAHAYIVKTVTSKQSADLSLTVQKQTDSDVSFSNQTISNPVSPLHTEKIIASSEAPIGYMHITTSLQSQSAALVALLPKPKNPNTWTVNALGDIIPGRTVYKITNNLHDQTAPYTKTAAFTAAADLTLANLECPFSDNIDHPTLGMAFSAPSTGVEGLKLAGIDAVNLANNHSYNEGAGPFGDTMNALDSAKIKYFGGGHNENEARTPQIMTVKGVRIALLGYSSIIGSVEAGPTKSGMATLSMAPWGPFEEAPVAQMEKDIQAAKAQADLVFVYFHWGTEYTHDANTDQRTVAHRAIDAGADLILGTHPHWVQGVEWYQGKLITYSLGNFVFDQDWSTETKQGTVLTATFDGRKLIAAELKPYEIENFYQPQFTEGAASTKILSDVFDHSWWVSK